MAESRRGARGPQALQQWGAGTQPRQSQAEAGRAPGMWVLAAGHWGWDRCPEVAPAPHIFNSAVPFATAFIPFVLLYAAAATCVWREEMWMQTQLVPVTAGGSSTRGAGPSVHTGSAGQVPRPPSECAVVTEGCNGAPPWAAARQRLLFPLTGIWSHEGSG